MRKALKRELGRQKQAQNLQESIESGLRAQGLDRKQREEALRQALLKRDSKPARPENEGNSRKAQEKKARVAAREAELRELNAQVDMDDLQSELDRPDGDLGVARDFVQAVMIGRPAGDAFIGPAEGNHLNEYAAKQNIRVL